MLIQITPSKDYSMEELESFFGDVWDKQTDREKLYEYGRYMLVHGKKKAFFAILPAGDQSGWLRALYMKEGLTPAFLMMVFEWVQQEAVRAGFKHIYALSRDESTETLLETSGFQRIDQLPTRIDDQQTDCSGWVWTA